MKSLVWTGARFQIIAQDSSDREQLKEAGWHFDWSSKIWWSGLIETARQFENLADSRAKQKFIAQDQQVNASQALTSTTEFTCPPGLAYLPFQKAGIEYALARPYVLIADEMGTGKSIEAIGVINADPTIKTILVVCPASLMINWARELMKWCVRKYSGDFATSKIIPDSDIIIANYEIMHKIKPFLQKRKFDLHIYDESHRIKNEEAQCTRAILGSEHVKDCFPLEARRKLFLTGTPILNRPIELWPMLRVIDPEGLGSNFWLYARRFCGGDEQPKGLRDFMGATNLDTLNTRLRSACMIRRTKSQVMTELPPKRRQIIPIPTPLSVEKTVQRELEFYNSNQDAIERAVQEAAVAQAAGDQASYNAAAQELRGLKRVVFEELAKLRHDTAVAKVPYIIKYLEEALQQVNKLVLFAHHQDVLNPILEKFSSVAVKLDGNMSSAQKQTSVDRFQTDPRVKLFIGSLTAAGVGITLTAASSAIFAELSYVPAHLTQAEDRLHRIGQHDAVNIFHVVFYNSLDCNIVKKLIEKQEVIDQILK